MGDPGVDFLRSGVQDVTTSQDSQHARQSITAVELADIAGVEANTVRKIAKELFDMLKRDVEMGGLTFEGESP